MVNREILKKTTSFKWYRFKNIYKKDHLNWGRKRSCHSKGCNIRQSCDVEQTHYRSACIHWCSSRWTVQTFFFSLCKHQCLGVLFVHEDTALAIAEPWTYHIFTMRCQLRVTAKKKGWQILSCCMSLLESRCAITWIFYFHREIISLIIA